MKKNETLKKQGDVITLSESFDKDKKKTGEVRMTLESYNGRKFLDVRKWFLNDEGNWQSTQKGIALSTPALVKSLMTALKANEKVIVDYLSKKD